MMTERVRERVWAVMVGLVLADSSVVTLALPDILRAFDTTVFGVSWVLTAFNLVLAVAILPVSRLARRAAPRVWTAGLVLFASASLVCAGAPSIGILIAARCAQALGGAAVMASAIELLAGTRSSHRKAAPAWGTAGIVGLAVGPAAGGLLTEVFSWEAIFLIQLPVLLAVPVAAGRFSRAVEPGPASRIDPAPEVALGLLSAGLTGALFLLVIMLIEGWRNSPLEAAAIVSVVPAATLAARVLASRAGHSGRFLASGGALVASGAILVAGGLAALGLLPGAAAGWTFAPQLLIGAGIALALPGLTERALSVHDPGGGRAAATIAARHAGIVLGILLLTPIFSDQLTEQHRAAQRSGTAFLLDAQLPAKTKIALARAIGERIKRADGRLPDLSPAFRQVAAPADAGREYRRLETKLDEEVEKAATHAFSESFLLAGALALAALVPIGVGWRR
jgi:MFS family permease